MAERKATLGLGFHTINLDEVKAKHGNPPWSELIVFTDEMQGILICQAPDHPNDKHYHHHDEWWVVLEGEIHWEIEGQSEPAKAKVGNFVYVPKEHYHHIHVKGDKPSIRLAISVAGERHLHDK